MVETVPRSSIRREKWLTLLNLAAVTWLFGFNGLVILQTLALQLVWNVGLTPSGDMVWSIVGLGIAPLLLPIGWIGVMIHFGTGGNSVSWLFLISNAGLWVMFVAFLWRLIETGDFQSARDASFIRKRHRRRVRPAAPNFEKPADTKS